MTNSTESVNSIIKVLEADGWVYNGQDDKEGIYFIKDGVEIRVDEFEVAVGKENSYGGKAYENTVYLHELTNPSDIISRLKGVTV